MANSTPKAQATSSSVSIEVQIPTELHREILTASSVNGVTVEQFILNAAYKAALKTTESEGVVLLDQEAWDRLTKVVKNPSSPTPALRQLMRT